MVATARRMWRSSPGSRYLDALEGVNGIDSLVMQVDLHLPERSLVILRDAAFKTLRLRGPLVDRGRSYRCSAGAPHSGEAQGLAASRLS